MKVELLLILFNVHTDRSNILLKQKNPSEPLLNPTKTSSKNPPQLEYTF